MLHVSKTWKSGANSIQKMLFPIRYAEIALNLSPSTLKMYLLYLTK